MKDYELALLKGVPLYCKTVLQLGSELPLYNYTARDAVPFALDWSGNNGALPMDMRFSIHHSDFPHDWPHQFDLITNFNFSNWVTAQEPVWANIHNFLAVNGVLAVALPCAEQSDEGYWLPEHRWLINHAAANDYLYKFVQNWVTSEPWMTIALFCKVKDSPFKWIGHAGMHRTHSEFTTESLRGPGFET